ncbi:MAG: hypothetical protein ACK4Z9_05220 [Thermodesulfovibrionales bacterium]
MVWVVVSAEPLLVEPGQAAEEAEAVVVAGVELAAGFEVALAEQVLVVPVVFLPIHRVRS